MLSSYLKSALRLLWRERGTAAVNVFGLAVGLAVCLGMGRFLTWQLGYDGFHEKGKRIYRVLRTPPADPMNSGLPQEQQTAPLGPALAQQLPAVVASVRFAGSWERLLRPADAPQTAAGTYVRDLLYADAGVFDVFSFELLAGDPRTALSRPRTLVLTPDLAQQLFGDADPVGKVLRLDDREEFTVTGIVAPPVHSSLSFTALASFTTQYEYQRQMMVEHQGGWNMTAFSTFVLLAPGADAATVQAGIADAIRAVTDEPLPLQQAYRLQPLSEVHLDTEAGNGLGPGSDPRYVALCGTVAVLILLLASFNYVNLATARAGRRAREIGVRKALGAGRGRLLRQLLGESVLLAVLAGALAVVVAQAAIPLLPHVAGVDIPGLAWTPGVVCGGALLVVTLGLASGLYPAWTVSRLQPATMARRGPGGAGLRRGLVVAQFAVTATLMTVTLVVWQQLDYIQGRRLGLAAERVVMLQNGALPPEAARAFKAELLRDHRIAAVSLAQSMPTRGTNRMGFTLEGRFVRLVAYQVDGDFVGAMGLRVAAGRAVTDDPGDAGAIVLNEAAVRMLGWAEPLGRTFTFNGVERHVVGVVEDFHYESLHHAVEPLYMVPTDGWVSYAAIRIGAGHTREGLQAIADAWKAFAPHHPIRYSFLDDAFAQLYDDEQRLARISTAFFGLAIAIALVGLFGLAAHTAQARTREIGVRKVFGASVASVASLVSRDFVVLVALAFALSVPVAWWTARQWLQDFAYHVDVGAGVFLVSGAASLTLALLTVGQQAIRAGLADPVATLRHE